jgi:hypothetical protein
MTDRRYIEKVLEPHVIPFAENMGPVFISNQSSAKFNAIEHVWDTLGQQLKERQLLGRDSSEVILNFFGSMPRRCAEVLRVRGSYTH